MGEIYIEGRVKGVTLTQLGLLESKHSTAEMVCVCVKINIEGAVRGIPLTQGLRVKFNSA
jgi:cytoskeletal protein CcmA (bactofilin family)